MSDLNAIDVNLKSGDEPFSFYEKELGFNLLNFWSWSQSDLLSNSLRGVIAEYIVKQDLDIDNGARIEWDAYDLITKSGVKVEVKSSAYLQSWKQKEFSKISFDISPSRGWDSQTNEYSKESKRQSDFYIFCLLKHQDKETVNPLKLEQWTFYVLPTETLDEKKPNQKRITLNSLLQFNPKECIFGEIKEIIKF
ncbi:MAG: hypothetical protein COA97_08590 [Flavobacteriales bacterium]|nr:MAG: hypothetical protein COA97_08590 [Flavobacteriales bacterium]